MVYPGDGVLVILTPTWEFHAVIPSLYFRSSFQVSLFLLLAQAVIKALFLNWGAGGVCFQLAEILHEDGGCVSGTSTDAQNLLTDIKI